MPPHERGPHRELRAHDYRGSFAADGTRIRPRRRVPEVPAARGTVVEDAATGFCGAVVRADAREVTVEDRHGRHRVFPLRPAAFLVDGKPATLVPPPVTRKGPARSASGSVAVVNPTARTARASRIWVEGIHDAALVETVWGHDLRVEGVVVEPMHGMDDLAAAVAAFGPAPHRRLGILVDHLVDGSKETRAAHAVAGPHVLVTGHPFVDVWQAVNRRRSGFERGRWCRAGPTGRPGCAPRWVGASRPTARAGCWVPCRVSATWRPRSSAPSNVWSTSSPLRHPKTGSPSS